MSRKRAVSIYFQSQDISFDIDVVDQWDPIYSANVTQYPVEKGSNKADHRDRQPKGLNLGGQMSDVHPWRSLTDEDIIQPFAPLGYDRERLGDHIYFREALLAAHENDEFLTIEAGQRGSWPDMQITNLSLPGVVGAGSAVMFSLSLVFFEFAETETKALNPKPPAAPTNVATNTPLDPAMPGDQIVATPELVQRFDAGDNRGLLGPTLADAGLTQQIESLTELTLVAR